MKKRFKLITTIASLCLALGMVAFGVYAATSLTLTGTTSTVSFTAEDVFVDIQVEYFWGPSSGLFEGTTYRTANYTGTTYSGSGASSVTTAATFSPTLSAQAVSYSSDKPSAGIRITLSNALGSSDGNRAAYFTIKTLPVAVTGTTITTFTVGGEAYSTANTAKTLAVGGTAVVILYQRTLTDFTSTLASTTGWESVIKIGNTSALATAS